MERKRMIKQNTGGRLRTLLPTFFAMVFFCSGVAAVYGANDAEMAELSREGYSRADIGDRTVFWKMRKIGEALVERDFTVVQFDAGSRRRLSGKEHRRPGLPGKLPPVISRQDAFFGYMNSGYTVKDAYDRALADYPMCAPPNDCIRFAGDESFAGPYLRPGASPTPSASSVPTATPLVPPPSPPPTPSAPPSPVPTPTVWSPAAWPAGSGTEIGGGLPSGYEPSGAVWHERLGVLFLVSDDGWVSWMDQSGTSPTTWTPGGDLEGIAVADPSSDYLYLGVEDPDSIREFDISTGALTGKSWNLTAWMTGDPGSGLEALTFVPDGDHPYPPSSSGGLFYAGLQADGRIYVFDADLAHSGTVSHVDTIEPFSGLTDLSGLHYHAETGILYAVFDSWNLLLEMETDGTVVEVYELPGDTQEGVTLMPSCPISETSIFIAEDSGEVWRYDGYPVNCPATPTSSPSLTPPAPPTPSPRYTHTPIPFLTPTPTPSPDVRIIICLGDSVTHGYPYADNGNPQLTYPSLLSGLMELEYGPDSFAVFNQGVNGYKAEDVVNDLSLPGALSEDPDYVLLMIGGNDLAQANFITIAQIIEETTWEVQSCVDLIKAHTNAGGFPPEVIVSAFIPNLLEDGWGTLAIAWYNSSLSTNLSGYDLWFTANWDDFYDTGTGEAKVSLMYDSIHPNSDGYQVMAENWFEALGALITSVTPTPSPQPSPTPPTPTPSPTVTVSPTASPSASPSPTASLSPTPSATPAPTATASTTSTPIVTPTVTPIPAPTSVYLVVDWDDYDGDGTSDLAVYDHVTGEWSIENITSGLVWGGGAGDIPAPGDYDGDGTADAAYFNRFSGQWSAVKITGEVITTGVQWGAWGDVPAPGDYDGDRTCDLATWRRSDGRWRIRDITNKWYGQVDGIFPVPGDYNGDGTTDIAMIWPSSSGGTNIWYVNGVSNRCWMMNGGIPIPMDYDGDGTTDLGVYNPSKQYWCIRHLEGPTMYFKHWGIPGDIPAVGDFDGDGRADLVAFRNTTGQAWWWIFYSSKPYYYSHFSAQTGDNVVTGATSY